MTDKPTNIKANTIGDFTISGTAGFYDTASVGSSGPGTWGNIPQAGTLPSFSGASPSWWDEANNCHATASDMVLGASITPLHWKVKPKGPLNVHFSATLANNSDQEKFISTYFQPQLILKKGNTVVSENGGSDMPPMNRAANIIDP